MNIVDAHQQFAVHEHKVMQSGRLAQATKNTMMQPASTETQRLPAPYTTSQISQPPQGMTTTTNPEQQLSAETSVESTSSDAQNEDKRRFNALQTVGAVKRILDQLSTGKLLSWIDGTAMEKIQAQLTDHEQNNAPAAASSPAPSAPAASVTEWSYRYQELNANFSGELSMADGTNFSWSFELAMREEQFSFRTFNAEQLKDPLIVSLGGTPAELKNQGLAFDLLGDGQRFQFPDLGQGQFYLMQDLNNNQHLDSGLELFGPNSGKGFNELAALDDNKNGFIEATDSRWQSLNLWSRQQGIQSLQQAGIAAISAQSVATSFGLYDGEALLGRIARSGIFLGEQNQGAPFSVGLVQQVDLNI
jgi:hypothetical protein